MRNWKERSRLFLIGILLAVSVFLAMAWPAVLRGDGVGIAVSQVMAAGDGDGEVPADGTSGSGTAEAVTWRDTAGERGIYDFTEERWMIGTYYLGENLAEIFQMMEDPDLPGFDLDTYLSHTVLAGASAEDLRMLQEEGVESLEDYFSCLPSLFMGEANPTISVRNYSSAVGIEGAFHVQCYPLNGCYGVCMKEGAPIVTGTVYTRIDPAAGDSLFYSTTVEQILGFRKEQQRQLYLLMTLVNNSARDAAFPGLPDTFWVSLVQRGAWLLIGESSWQACVADEDEFIRQLAFMLWNVDHVNSDVDFNVNGTYWASEESLKEIFSWLKDWCWANGYSTLYWYYVPGTGYQPICVPDIDHRIQETGWLELTKSGAHTGTQANVAGAVYGVYRDSACTKEAARMTLNSSGYGKTGALPVGTYYVREISAGSGVIVNSAVYPAEIASGRTTNLNASYAVTDEEWQGTVTITKTDSLTGYALTGAVFSLYEYRAADGEYVYRETLTDSGDGTYRSGTLYYTSGNQGRFRVAETTAPKGYGNSGWAQNFALTKEEQTLQYSVKNTPTRYRFVKMDGEGKPLAGCEFRLTAEDGSLVDSWITDAAGVHEIVGLLEPGMTYFLEETAVPVGYEPAAVQSFTAEAADGWVTVNTWNRMIPAAIRVTKVDGGRNPMAGVVFVLFSTEIREGEEPLVRQGKTWYPLSRVTTDADGKAVFDGLDTVHGYEYLLAEVSTEEGASLPGDFIEIGALPMAGEEAPDASYSGIVQEKEGILYLYEVSVTVLNGKSYVLPNSGAVSGGRGYPALWMAGAAALLCAWMERTHRKKKG